MESNFIPATQSPLGNSRTCDILSRREYLSFPASVRHMPVDCVWLVGIILLFVDDTSCEGHRSQCCPSLSCRLWGYLQEIRGFLLQKFIGSSYLFSNSKHSFPFAMDVVEIPKTFKKKSKLPPVIFFLILRIF